MTKVLVVDDEETVVNVVRAYLERDGFRVVAAADGPTALKLFQLEKPDVVVLDIMLPGLDGLEVLQRMRAQSDAYVILLTARTEEVDRIVGLTLGADDYVVKPFSPRELVARIRAVLRRSRERVATRNLEFPSLSIDEAGRKVYVSGRQVELTPIEFDLLLALARHPGQVLSRQQLMDLVWGTDDFVDDRIVDVHIGKLRRKLGDDPTEPRLIATVRGGGYRFEELPA
jgi:two-component system alkaline phosphatase synthesis response regulator PhoP